VPALASTSDWAIAREFAFGLSFAWLCTALGRRVLRWLGAVDGASTLERGVIALALGMGALQYVPLALGASSQLSPLSLRLAVGAVACACALDLWAVAGSLSAAWADTKRMFGVDGWPILVALAPALLVAGLCAATPTIDADGVAYHLTIPKRWLDAGSFVYMPTYPNSNTPLGGEMLFMIGLVFGGDISAKLTHLILGLTGALALQLAGTRLHSRALGAAAAVLSLVGPAGLIPLLGTAYVEGSTAFGMIASALAWLIWRDTRSSSWLWTAALLAGVAVSFKLTAGLFPVALAALTLLQLRQPLERPFGQRALQVLRLLPAVVLPVAPWLLRSFLVTGNPVYPLFAAHIPSLEQSPALAARYDQFNRYFNWASRMGPEWDLDTRKLILAGAALLFVAMGTVAYRLARTQLGRGTVVVVTATALVQLAAAGLYTRYWQPIAAVLLLPLLLVVPAAWWTKLSRWPAAAVVLLCAAYHARAAADGELVAMLRVLAGLDEPRAYLQQRMPIYPVFEAGNRALPPDARIMLSCTCNGFYFDRTTYCAEFPQEGLRSTTWSEFTADVQRLGITHVMAPQVLATNGPRPPLEYSSASILHRAREYDLVGHLLSKHGTLIATGADFGLYQVDAKALDRNDQLEGHLP
jgi:hypothetical protein